MFEPNKERQSKLHKLSEWYSTLKDGRIVSWVEAEQETGIRLGSAKDQQNRALVQYTAKRLKRPYKTLVGRGFQVSSAENANDIADDAINRLNNQLDNARNTVTQLSARHIDEMTQDQRNRLMLRQATLGAIGLSGSLAKKLPAKLEGNGEKK